MRALMVQGVSSSAGKSLLVTALARHFARSGVRVAPFKAQNMSNHARVVAGGEIGTAQYLQALAAGVEPDVRMNPVLVKPEHGGSQVVRLGRVDPELTATPWRLRAPALRSTVDSALASLAAEHELLLVEGAGSPAEINLADADLANLHVADRLDPAVLLVADIDRGGAFAHLYGTWSLLPAPHRVRIRGHVLNKFRGDAALLAPAPERLAELTGAPVVGVLPMLDHALPDEDSVRRDRPYHAGGLRVRVVRYPTASNLDEFHALEQAADVRWVTEPGQLAGADLVVLPGSKHVSADLAWLRATGLDAALRHSAAITPVLAVCGGLQMLGARLEDPAGVDGAGPGLGLLPLVTAFERGKTVRRTSSRFGTLQGPWAGWSGLPVAGYEIRHGRTERVGALAEALPDGLGWTAGTVLAVYLHGLLEDPALLDRLPGSTGGVRPAALHATFDRLADAVERHLDLDRVRSWLGGGHPGGPPG